MWLKGGALDDSTTTHAHKNIGKQFFLHRKNLHILLFAFDQVNRLTFFTLNVPVECIIPTIFKNWLVNRLISRQHQRKHNPLFHLYLSSFFLLLINWFNRCTKNVTQTIRLLMMEIRWKWFFLHISLLSLNREYAVVAPVWENYLLDLAYVSFTIHALA